MQSQDRPTLKMISQLKMNDWTTSHPQVNANASPVLEIGIQRDISQQLVSKCDQEMEPSGFSQVKKQTNRYTIESPKWKRTICSSWKPKNQKLPQHRIKQRYAMLTKLNPEIRKQLKNIVAQINGQMISSPRSVNTVKRQSVITNQITLQSASEQIHNKTSVVVEDSSVVKQSCYRAMLIPSKIDNDVPSDDEDLKVGVQFMYSQLLYSVGSQLVRQRTTHKTKLIHKRTKDTESNKQNHDNSNISNNIAIKPALPHHQRPANPLKR